MVDRLSFTQMQGDLSGKLGYEEFKDLWEDLRRWKVQKMKMELK